VIHCARYVSEYMFMVGAGISQRYFVAVECSPMAAAGRFKPAAGTQFNLCYRQFIFLGRLFGVWRNMGPSGRTFLVDIRFHQE
jgi:hypothetical protein